MEGPCWAFKLERNCSFIITPNWTTQQSRLERSWDRLEEGSTFSWSTGHGEVFVNQKEKSVEDALWLQIQGLVKKLGVLLLKKKERAMWRKGLHTGKRYPGNHAGEKCGTRPGNHDPNKKGEKLTKDPYHTKRRINAKRRNPLKLTMNMELSRSDQENRCDKLDLWLSCWDSLWIDFVKTIQCSSHFIFEC